MENKLTAVEYLEKTISHMLYNGGDLGEDEYYALRQHIQQAKAMEKEQISNGYYQGLIDGMNNSPKEYYNKTYGK